MSLLLLFDTSTKDCSVALAKNDQIVAERVVKNTQSHAKLLPNLFKEVLEEANITLKQVDTLVVSEGPGSYTGLRIGFATVKALAYTLNKPIIFIDILESLAQNLAKQTRDINAIYVSTMKSRTGEIYYAISDSNENIIKKSTPKKIEELSFKCHISKNIYLCGNAIDVLKDINIVNYKKNYTFVNIEPSAKYLLDNALIIIKQGIAGSYIYKNPKYMKPFMG